MVYILFHFFTSQYKFIIESQQKGKKNWLNLEILSGPLDSIIWNI